MPHRFRSASIAVLAALIVSNGSVGARGDATLRAKILASFAGLKSYRLTVLGAARSSGVWVAPDRYQMQTDLGGGDPIKTVIIGRDYWTRSEGKWEHAGRVSTNLDVDIAGLVRNAKADPAAPFERKADQTQDGKRVGTFAFTFKNGTIETCNFDRTTYRVTRCKADEVTLLYSGYNEPGNAVARPTETIRIR